MCTVTYIPFAGGIFLTASRDEQKQRPPALRPGRYKYSGRKMLFPKDPLSGGSWIAVTETGRALALLNGADQAHLSQPPYRKSRGLILLDLASAADPVAGFQQMALSGIEPFTVIIAGGGRLAECRWNGSGKQIREPDADTAHIWSSATLYGPDSIKKRQGWFSSWMRRNPSLSLAEIVRFHREGGDGDPFDDFLMNRNGQVFTQSICSVYVDGRSAEVHYLDLLSGITTIISIDQLQTIAANR